MLLLKYKDKMNLKHEMYPKGNKFYGGIEMKNLKGLYAEWREASEQMLEEGFKGSVDCGNTAVREDFSAYAELQETITFEEMLELEKEYNK